mgnify:CR=1 FL=1
MVKITPNPPRAENLSAYTTLDTKNSAKPLTGR